MKYLLIFITLFQPSLLQASSQALIGLNPQGSTSVQIPSNGNSIVKYTVTNRSKRPMQMTMVPTAGINQITSNEYCQSPMNLKGNQSCTLAVQVDLNYISQYGFVKGPKVCKTKSDSNQSPDPYLCCQPGRIDILKISNLNPNFPYGTPPVGNVCVSQDYYATPESMLGSWAMLQAISNDSTENVLPSFMTPNNTVYAVGTAAIGALLGISNCSGGCNELNGFCFALKFDQTQSPHPNYPYMIFQSVNIGANTNSFDIYLPGGGAGAFPNTCAGFWNTNGSVNWSNHIEDSTCNSYFNNFNFSSPYNVTYNGVTYNAVDTLKNACTFSYTTSGFSVGNFNNVKVVPVTCPTSLTQITGVRLADSVTTVGNQSIQSLATITDASFNQTSIPAVTTTQMQDCKTPSSGYCGNVNNTVVNYEYSISTTTTAPILTGSSPSGNYCQQNPNASGFCSWNNGQSSGGTYCNQSQTICLGCGNSPKWCGCKNGQVTTCVG